MTKYIEIAIVGEKCVFTTSDEDWDSWFSSENAITDIMSNREQPAEEIRESSDLQHRDSTVR